jgi:NAD(P)-dependent dehydrogenase (short-subunit alcohol dehydrogenase family)
MPEQTNLQHLSEKTALVVGGTSGLGFELAQGLHKAGYRTLIAGRHNPEVAGLVFYTLNLGEASVDELCNRVTEVLDQIPRLDLVVYAPGFYQEGTIDELTNSDISAMLNVGLMGCVVLVNQLMSNQNAVRNLIVVTSTSQWTPRLLEPVYTAVKAGLGMFANSISLDKRVGKVLVAAPAGMATKFWEDTERDLTAMLEPRWVAEKIVEANEGNFDYKFVQILREPPRVELVEER